MKPYPLSYFSSIVTARQILAGRIGSKIWQKILTTFFLISLLIIPSSLQTARLETYLIPWWKASLTRSLQK